MTFLQQTLGKNYKWWYQYKTAFKSSTAYRWSNLSWLFGRILILGFTILLWKINIDAGSNLFTFNQIFTYYIIGGIFFVDNGIHYGVSQHIKDGRLSTRMLFPSNTLFSYFVGDIGWHAFTDILERIIFVLIAIFGHQYLILPSVSNLPFFLVLIIIGFFIKIYYHFLLGFVGFVMTDIFGVVDSQATIVGFLSGKVLPLTSATFLLPLTYLPFAFLYHQPMQVYFGNSTSIQMLQTIFTGLVWLVVLHILTIKFWKYGLKRFEAVGL